jgi:HEAT repeat protein
MLGTNAAFATGRLTELLQDQELAFVAARCLAFVGKAAEPALCQCLTNQDSSVRELALGPLASVTETVELYVARIKPLLQDQDSSVRCATIVAIGAQTQAPDLALPLLIPALDSPDDGVARVAAKQLANFGTNATGALPRLVLLVEEDRVDPAKAALTAIPKIAPTKAVGILSNTVAVGNPSLMHVAVTQLRPIQEQLALRLLIEQLRSPERLRNSSAIGVAETYETTTPGIADALKAAAKNADPDLSRQAKVMMRHLVKKQKEKNGSRVDIPGEPSYQGKTLGEWLEMRVSEGGLATNAVAALNHMGPNVVPAHVGRLSYKEPVFGVLDENASMGAAFGLMAIKEKAVPALPQLRSLMSSEDEGLALRAMIATAGAGKDAAPCIMAGLTNEPHRLAPRTGRSSRRRRILRRPGSSLPDVGANTRPQITGRPMNATEEEILENRVGPNVLAVPQVGVEDPAAPVTTSPGGWVRRPLVHRSLHPLRVLDQNHVQVRRKTLKRVPLLQRAEIFRKSFHAGEMRIGRNHPGALLFAMNDELATNHGDIRIHLVRGVVFIPRLRVAVVRTVKGVRGAMRADEALPTVNRGKERLFAFDRHGRVFIGARLGQIAGRVEVEGVELVQILPIE